MNTKACSIRSFIGAKDYAVSRDFYAQLGFEEVELSHNLCYFKIDENLGFYLQDAYVQDWVNNTMIFLEVDDVENWEKTLQSKKLQDKFSGVRISKIKHEIWGRELFMHDPSGILWHVGAFNK